MTGDMVCVVQASVAVDFVPYAERERNPLYRASFAIDDVRVWVVPADTW